MGWKRNRLEAMNDTDLADVHLVGTDDEEIACNKAFLATTSPVFKRMFFRGFREQNEARCRLNYHSTVLTMIVKHCYCGGEVDMSEILDGSRSLEEEATFLVELCDAARYFELDEMHSDLETEIGNLVFKHGKYRYAWALLTGMLERGEDDGTLWCKLVQFVVENPKNCFDSTQRQRTGIITTNHPHPNVLAEVLRRTKDTFVVVKCLQTWFARENKVIGAAAAAAGDGTNNNITETIQALMEIAGEVDLKQLSIHALSKITPSSLFPTEKIEEAVEQHQYNRRPTARASRPKLYCVFGATAKRVNGCYRPLDDELTSRGGSSTKIYYKDEVYQRRTCLFVIHHNAEENKWLLSMTREKFDVLSRTGTVNLSLCQLHFYEAPSLEEETHPQVPFNGWTCLEEATGNKSPIVAPIYKVEKSAVELEYESRRSNWV
mmetsp:Transcript_38642/g.93408  ORF Transcript_38642/g.93408 Transcript_38642/m.93408 type:complete len:434 (-) Transcript_38642:96-1397(-)